MNHNLNALFAQIAGRLSTDPNIHLHALAQNLGVDRHTIEQAVRIHAGVSFREYRDAKRLNKGIALLLHSDLCFKEIALKLGYSAFDSFSRFIKRNTGDSPRQIRRNALPPQVEKTSHQI
jgi:transcriptional regulator GlxA family with amidase domain